MRLVSIRLCGWCALLLATSALQAQETVFYRCTDGSGGVTMQNDKPCAAGMKQEIRRVSALPTAPAPTRSAPAPTFSAPPPGAQFELVVGPRSEGPPSTVPEADRVPPPTLFQCRTWDEDDYLSEDGEPEPRCAPLQTTDANGDPNGGAGSACEMVRDTCTAADGDALCKVWQQHVDEAEFRWKFAGPDDSGSRKAEYERRAKLLADSNCKP